MEDILWILTIIASILFLMVGMIALQVWLAAKSKLKPLKQSIIELNNKLERNKAVHQWAENNDFTFIKAFQFAIYHVATWKYNRKPTFLCLHTNPAWSIELITVFENNIILCTASSSNWQDSPHFFGYYLQTFSNISIDELWLRHTEMEDYLMETGKVKLSKSEIIIEDFLNSYRKNQTDHVRSFAGWPVRALYWSFIRKHAWHNKSIKDQHEKGMIKLPIELALQYPYVNAQRKNL